MQIEVSPRLVGPLMKERLGVCVWFASSAACTLRKQAVSDERLRLVLKLLLIMGINGGSQQGITSSSAELQRRTIIWCKKVQGDSDEMAGFSWVSFQSGSPEVTARQEVEDWIMHVSADVNATFFFLHLKSEVKFTLIAHCKLHTWPGVCCIDPRHMIHSIVCTRTISAHMHTGRLQR